MTVTARPLALVAFATVAALASCVRATNPFDPDTPLEGQHPGLVTGTVFGLREPVDGVNAPGLCALKDVPGDHSGFTIALRPLADDPDLGVGVETAATNASGKFQLKNIPPGRYSFEVFADGFAVPPPAEVTVDIGATLTRTLCALDTDAPTSPALAPLPPVIDADDEVLLTILAPEPATTYTVIASAPGQPVEAPPPVTAADDAEIPVALALGLNVPARVSWVIEVSATDALGNTSTATQVVIVRDAIPPPAPADVRATAALDRAFLTWSSSDASPEDDGALGYLVSYNVAPRPQDDLAGCPFGKPGDATGDDAFFAVEGPSPVETTATQQTLSGLTPGTELFVYVAAFDAANNNGCYAPPVRVRPDVVTFVREGDRGPSVSGASALVFLEGSTGAAGAGGYAVVGADGSLVVDSLGASHVVDTEATDAAVAGDTLALASGLLGVTQVPLDRLGIPGTTTASAVGTTAAVAGEPGLAWAATSGGLFAGATQVVTGDFAAVELAGALAIGVRTAAGGFEVVAFDRADAFSASNPLALNEHPRDTAVVDRTLVLVTDSGDVRAVSFAGCLALSAPAGCLVETGHRALPGGETARSVSALDDVVLVGSAEGSVFALALPSLTPLGRIDLGAPVQALIAEDLGFCAALDAAGAASPVVACATVAGFPLQDGELRGATSSPAARVAIAGGRIVASTGEALYEAPLAHPEDSVEQALGAAVVDVAAVGSEALALVADGRVMLARNGRAPTLVVDLAALTSDAPNLELPAASGFLVAAGGELFVVLRGANGDAALAQATLTAAADGAVTAVVDDVLVLSGVRVLTDLLVHQGRAYVATAPVGIFAVDLEPLTLGADSALPGVDTVSFAAATILVGTADAPRVVTPTRSADGTDGFAVLAAGALAGVASSTPVGVNGGTRAGRFVAVTTFGFGAFLLTGQDQTPPSLVPILALPSVAEAQEVAVGARGLVFADGAGGIARVFVR